jgi:hypothetical protein
MKRFNNYNPRNVRLEEIDVFYVKPDSICPKKGEDMFVYFNSLTDEYIVYQETYIYDGSSEELRRECFRSRNSSECNQYVMDNYRSIDPFHSNRI